VLVWRASQFYRYQFRDDDLQLPCLSVSRAGIKFISGTIGAAPPEMPAAAAVGGSDGRLPMCCTQAGFKLRGSDLGTHWQCGSHWPGQGLTRSLSLSRAEADDAAAVTSSIDLLIICVARP
jgi:hypothetical protein